MAGKPLLGEMSELENRIVELEIALAHQQDLLQELSDVLYRQQQQIDGLERKNELLERRITALTPDEEG